MNIRALLSLSVAVTILGTLPGCCCCLPGFRGPVPLPMEGKGVQNLPVRYPWISSPVVALTTGGGGKKGGASAWQVWDMQAMKQLGAVPGQSGSTLFVSPDGAYLAIEVFKAGS